MIYTSYRVDPSGLFWGEGFERIASEYMLDGKYILGYERLDGRKLNEVYAKNVPEAPQVLINGSSRSMTITKDIAPGKTFYNCANTGGDRYDFFNGYYIFSKENKEPSTVILSIDPWLFSPSAEAIDKRSNKAMYYEFMNKELGFTEYKYVPTDKNEKYKALISPSYFQSSVRYYLRDTSQELKPQPLTEHIHEQNTVVKCPDGSIAYDNAFLHRTKEEIDIDLMATTRPSEPLLRMFDFYELDPVFEKQFIAFIEYLQAKNIEVVLFLPPYHKYFYDAADAQRDLYQSFFDVEDFCIDTAKKYNLKLYGSFSAEKLGMEYDDFLDSFHMHPDSVYKALPVLF
ncbi:MAG: hypothetical protein RR273_02335 [Oscillospiraceae bacterium]